LKRANTKYLLKRAMNIASLSRAVPSTRKKHGPTTLPPTYPALNTLSPTVTPPWNNSRWSKPKAWELSLQNVVLIAILKASSSTDLLG
jgi:hypothetical protein